jgi:hypothetical protein
VSIRLVLDGSALAAYAGGDFRAVELGELLLSVGESGDITAVPALALIEAYQLAEGDRARAMLLELAADEGLTVCLPVLAADVAVIADLARGLATSQAHAVAEARKHHSYLATYQRPAYAGTMADEDILDL